MPGSPRKRAKREAAQQGETIEHVRPAKSPDAPAGSLGRTRKLDDLITVKGRDPITKQPFSRDVTRAERIIELVRSSNYKVTAAAIAGIGESTLYDWLAIGREQRSRGEQTGLTDFLDAVEAAEAESEAIDIAFINAAGQDHQHWQARAWVRERKDPAKFGAKTRLAIETTVKTEMAEEFVTFIAQVLEHRIADAEVRTAIIDDILGWASQGSPGGMGS